MFILRVGRENLEMAQTCMLLTTKIGSVDPVRVRVLHVGGTLEKVEQKYKVLSENWLETTNKKLENKFASLQE